jgi:hypothetical protein
MHVSLLPTDLRTFLGLQDIFHRMIFCSTGTRDIYAGFLVWGWGVRKKWLRGESEKA